MLTKRRGIGIAPLVIYKAFVETVEYVKYVADVPQGCS